MFNQEKYDYCKRFVNMIRHTKGSHAGEPFQLLAYQDDFLRYFLSDLDEAGTRIKRTCFCSMAKGNGKSTFAALIGLLFLLADDEPRPNIAIAASSKDQAGEIFREILAIRKITPNILHATHAIASQFILTYPKGGGLLKCMGKSNKTTHGPDLSLLIFDELHTLDDTRIDKEYFEALKWGADKDRRHAATLFLTTAGTKKSGPCWDTYSYATKVRDKKVIDDTFLPIIYESTEDDDPALESTWKKSNPGYGYNIDPKKYREKFNEAKVSPATLSAFRRLRQNCWGTPETAFIDVARFDDCKVEKYPDLKGLPITLGLDLSSARDLTALAGFVVKDGKYYVIAHCWTTADCLKDRERRNQANFRPFIQAGQITEVDGNRIDYKLVREKIKEYEKDHPIAAIIVDHWGSNETCQILMEQGYQVFIMPQQKPWYHEPLKKFEKLILDKKLVHNDKGGLWRWCISNLQVVDKNDLWYPSKEKSVDKIDFCTAIVQALSQMRDEPVVKKPSIYESRGLLSVKTAI